MKIKKYLFLVVCFFCIICANSCTKKQNKNLVVHSPGRDPRIDNFFNAVGIPLKYLDGNDAHAVSADLSRTSPLFTNALPPKIPGNLESSPFFTLAKNVGVYFASQIWKTQITSTDDVRFFDLSKDVNDQSGVRYKSSDFNMPAVFLNSYGDKTQKTDPKNYLGSVMNGLYGKLDFGSGKFTPASHFYIMEYKLRDEFGSRDSTHVRTYYALVSVPVNQTQQYRLIMYSHAGDFGTSSSELITIFNNKLKDFVVVAPLFPGEPLCTQVNVQGSGCMRLDEKNNLVPDNIGTYNNPTLPIRFNSILPIAYERSPLIEDVNAFLGAHNAVARTMSLPFQENPFYSSTLPANSLLIPLEHPEYLINSFQSLGNDVNMIPTGLSPQTIGVGSSRGGAVLLASLGRMGFLMSGLSYDTQFPHSVQDGDGGETFQFQYPLFNSAALFFSPSSMLTGQLRLFTMMIMQDETEAIASLPMATDLAKNSFFTNYRNDDNYLSEIQPPVKNENGKFEKSAQDSLSQLVTFIATNDITFLAPFISSSLQNWNSFYSEKPFESGNPIRAPGSLILLQGSQDLVVPITESTIVSQAMNTVWAGLYNTPADPYGNYLSPLQFGVMHRFLKENFISGVGTAQYTFQPTNHFFNLPCDRKMLASIQQPEVIYNTDVNRCFGGGYSPNADGTNAVGNFYGHLDASFFTGRLVNTLPEDNLHMAVLSSNVITKSPTNYYTLDYDASRHMKSGRPKFETDITCIIGDNCTFRYTIPLMSPTFMRYMSAEGSVSSDNVAAKNQIFQGEFKSKNNSNVTPHDVFFAWLESVACDLCEPESGLGAQFQPHYGVFHDFTQAYPLEVGYNKQW